MFWEELDVKAGGGQNMTIGQMLRQWLIKLEWFSTLFPRIPVPIQQRLQKHLQERFPNGIMVGPNKPTADERATASTNRYDDLRDKATRDREIYRDRGSEHSFLRDRSRDVDVDRDKYRDNDRYRERYRGGHDYDRIRERSRDREVRRDRERPHSSSKHRDRHRHSSREREKYPDRSRERSRERSRDERDYSRDRERSGYESKKSRR